MVGLPAGQVVRGVVHRSTQECGSEVTRCWVVRHPEGVVRPPIRECGETPTEPGPGRQDAGWGDPQGSWRQGVSPQVPARQWRKEVGW